jgi:serine/threonine protein kinase
MSQKCQQKHIGKYVVLKTIGRGMLKVKLVEDPETKKTFAAKVCKSEFKKKSLDQEAALLKQINNAGLSNIIQIHEYIEKETLKKAIYSPESVLRKTRQSRFESCLIMEYAPNYTIFDFLLNSGQFDEKLSRTYFKKVMGVMDNIHKAGYAHRDIKSENLLLNEKYDLVLADFGFAKEFDINRSDRMHTKLGTELYLAPEMHLTGNSYSGTKADIFSCGALLFLMMFGRPPFFKASARDPLYKHFTSGNPEKFWNVYEEKLNNKKEYNTDLKNLINDLVSFDPEKRPSAQDVLEKYEWMKGETYTEEELIDLMGKRRGAVENALAFQKI